jgi:hypothetical protein
MPARQTRVTSARGRTGTGAGASTAACPASGIAGAGLGTPCARLCGPGRCGWRRSQADEAGTARSDDGTSQGNGRARTTGSDGRGEGEARAPVHQFSRQSHTSKHGHSWQQADGRGDGAVKECIDSWHLKLVLTDDWRTGVAVGEGVHRHTFSGDFPAATPHTGQCGCSVIDDDSGSRQTCCHAVVTMREGVRESLNGRRQAEVAGVWRATYRLFSVSDRSTRRLLDATPLPVEGADVVVGTAASAWVEVFAIAGVPFAAADRTWVPVTPADGGRGVGNTESIKLDDTGRPSWPPRAAVSSLRRRRCLTRIVTRCSGTWLSLSLSLSRELTLSPSPPVLSSPSDNDRPVSSRV